MITNIKTSGNIYIKHVATSHENAHITYKSSVDIRHMCHGYSPSEHTLERFCLIKFIPHLMFYFFAILWNVHFYFSFQCKQRKNEKAICSTIACFIVCVYVDIHEMWYVEKHEIWEDGPDRKLIFHNHGKMCKHVL